MLVNRDDLNFTSLFCAGLKQKASQIDYQSSFLGKKLQNVFKTYLGPL